MRRDILTLDEFRNKETRSLPNATGELSNLLRDIGLAAKRINVEVNKAGLVDILGDTGLSNVQGEEVKKLDEFANTEFTEVLRRGVSCAGVASEEMETWQPFEDKLNQQSKYVCLFDPLDGSSNIDVNISIGTIFSVYRRVSPVGVPVEESDFLQPGQQQVAAGYVIYGSSTMIVYATRRGVNGFTLDPSIGEFCLSHPGIKCPGQGTIYSVNHGNFSSWEKHVQLYIQACQQKGLSQRYVGSMVADIHRNLIKGGIFLYPGTSQQPGGKLRLQYECNPFAFIIETAGGKATDGQGPVLDIRPERLHQRTPFFAGSAAMMGEFGSYTGKGG
ncbi:MAG: class 1 fructose-bisphosphatase [Chitinophagaceae bacterium]